MQLHTHCNNNSKYIADPVFNWAPCHTYCYARRIHANTESSQYIKNTHGCYLVIKIYTEDTIDIGRHKETWNSYKYDLQAPLSTCSKRDKNTNPVPSSIQVFMVVILL